ncbi:hypothetical protein GCM10007416_32420 [Kroppenstedtia guangzhouensis]|uniref:Uncharacterized protein n=1 Tax=Kroppenstedtia guangzhouensis TaxID=1274356 RepID=A0ABQ1H3S4_9BACL|nr:hypothetical protein [Kroppenstedtia guangzhouensis]GGA56716.1 hypothetical protein GCM10007416_32420 [Kroppenstedtia guangzhouensis]
MMGKILISTNKYDLEMLDNPEMERKAADFWEGGFREVFPEVDNIDDLACFVYYMEKCAGEFMDLLIESVAEEEGIE